MRKVIGSSLGVGLLTGLLSLDFAAAAKPPKPTPTPTPAPTGCTTCEIVYIYTQEAKGNNTGRTDLMLMKKDGANKTVLLAGASGVALHSPRWAPDGTWIAFYTNAASGSSLRLIRADGTGLTTLVSRCSSASTAPAWRPIPTSNGYWLVYLDERKSDGTCLTAWPPGYTSPGRNLWAVNVSLAPTVLADDPVCLTCDLVALDGDYWDSPAWSRDGYHLSMLQVRRAITGVTRPFHVYDVTFDTGTGSPVLGHDWLFAPPEFNSPSTVPGGWAHWSDSVAMRTDNTSGTHGLQRFEIDLGSEPEGILSSTPLTTGSSFHFFRPVWSPEDDQLIDAVWTGSTSTDGIYVITPGPPFSLKLVAPGGSNLFASYPDWRKPPVP